MARNDKRSEDLTRLVNGLSGLSRWRLRWAGRRDGRRGIPDESQLPWPTPVIEELLRSGDFHVHRLRTEMERELEPIDAQLAALLQRLAAARSEAHRLAELSEQLRASGEPTVESAVGAGAKARRAARLAQEAAEVGRETAESLAAQRESIRAARTARVRSYKAAAEMHLALVEAATAVYWDSNLRRRKKGERHSVAGLSIPEAKLTDWPEWNEAGEEVDR